MKFNNKKVLIVPLDWGLGHATRCIPVIRYFLQANWAVTIAASGKQAALLQAEFPQLDLLSVPGYGIRYSKKRIFLPFILLLQVPRILLSIKKEHRWLQEAIATHGFDLVIADNRYGLHTHSIPCVFVTHQLCIKAPFRWLERMIQKLNFRYIRQFNECWIPDTREEGLSGVLAHSSQPYPFPVRYLGTLSRFEKKAPGASTHTLLFLVSGPEPQRSILEQKILRQLHFVNVPTLIVRGLPGSNEIMQAPPHISIVNHLEGAALETAMNNAAFIISRSGYTTIMEIASLQKKSILIPTPGQTEQEYLGKYLASKKYALTLSQEQLDLSLLIHTATAFQYAPFPVTTGHLDDALSAFLQQYFPGTHS